MSDHPATPGRIIPVVPAIPAAPLLADFADIAPVDCPCGRAQRALVDRGNRLCSLHRVEISANARTHYHRHHTEVYHVLDGGGEIELDGERRPLRPGVSVLIPPGVRHRAVVAHGQRMTILNFVMPPFDAADEHFD